MAIPKKHQAKTGTGGTTESNWSATVDQELSGRKTSVTPAPTDGWNDQEQYQSTEGKGEFTAGELGVPEDGEDGDLDGRGPLQQEGEGNRQNAQLAELEQDVDAKADLERRR